MMKKTILIVDDSQSIRDLLCSTLESEGYAVISCADGQYAIPLLDGRTIDLVITDQYMKEMNGIELVKQIRQHDAYKRVPVLFLTSETEQDRKAEAKAAGATGWVMKPFVPAKLVSAVKMLIK